MHIDMENIFMLNIIVKYAAVSTVLFILSYVIIQSHLDIALERVNRILSKYSAKGGNYSERVNKTISKYSTTNRSKYLAVFFIPVVRWFFVIVVFIFIFSSDKKFNEHFLN